MNVFKLIRAVVRQTHVVVLACSVFIVSCGGGSSQSAGVGGTGITTAKGVVVGKVTGFGSVYVNGNRYDTTSSNFIVDGDNKADQDDLVVGMVVRLGVETENGVFTDKAIDVVYDDEVQGPVAATPVEVVGSGGSQKTFNIFGQTITIDETGTVFEGTSFVDLDVDDVVEISGFRTSPTDIGASYVEWKDTLGIGSEIELRGEISGYVPPAQQFMLDGVVVNFDNLTDIDVNGGVLSNGLYVEVEGSYQAGSSVYAEEIEEEEQGFGDDLDDISLQGIISNYNDLDDFEIDGQQVDASAASLSPSNVASLLANGVEVEVEGEIVSGVLIAEELELRDGDTSLKSFVSFIYPDNLRFEVSYTGLVGSILVHTNGQTLFEDESPAQVPNFSVADMGVGDFVVVEGREVMDEVTAETVKRQDAANPDASELEGKVDMIGTGASITVLGITYGVDMATEYEGTTGPLSSIDFFNLLMVGDLVEIKDDVVADGIADKVELD
ncbi:MAG: hypothetical protein GY935_06330 [Gammaproteobacteria bacterium]|nr:hypothetical protein [Gammaproteobacteria bacterium]